MCLRNIDTDFLAAGGPENYAWNVVRSEADHLLFKHAAKSGAKAFDGVQIKKINFIDVPYKGSGELPHDYPGRPVSATYLRKDDNTTHEIKFDYIVDASGRVGLLSTKHLKNRRYNQGLKNVATWGYWKGAGAYGKGTPRENSPFFEALQGLYSQRSSEKFQASKYRVQMKAAGRGSSPCTTALYQLASL